MHFCLPSVTGVMGVIGGRNRMRVGGYKRNERVPSPETGDRLMHFLLIYELSADYLDRRAAFRDRHLAVAWQSAGRGEVVVGGGLETPVRRAVRLFAAGVGPGEWRGSCG